MSWALCRVLWLVLTWIISWVLSLILSRIKSWVLSWYLSWYSWYSYRFKLFLGFTLNIRLIFLSIVRLIERNSRIFFLFPSFSSLFFDSDDIINLIFILCIWNNLRCHCLSNLLARHIIYPFICVIWYLFWTILGAYIRWRNLIEIFCIYLLLGC